MKDKGHFFISLGKSLLRIWGCLSIIFDQPNGLMMFGIFFLLAEFLGILEEVADKR